MRFRPRSQEDLAPSGPQSRIAANLAAIRTVQTLEQQQRAASEQEQQVLARWSGWGAVPQLFDKPEFETQRRELAGLLDDESYAAARRSTQNAHFTDHGLVSALWQGVGELGVTGGHVLEPGCGSGTFMGLAPETATLTGIERDPISASIAAHLYPQAEVVTGSFADVEADDASFDAAIGNVPFARLALHDPRHNPNKHSLHNHFVLKSLHLTRPGGVVALLTSRYTLDAVEDAARVEMSQLADLVGAVRLPAGAHRRAAGTEAITDVLLLRRRETDAPEADSPRWRHTAPTAVSGSEHPINTYFLEHPQHVLGEFDIERGQFDRDDLTVTGQLDTLGQQLSDTLSQIATQAHEQGLTASTAAPRSAVAARPVSLRPRDTGRYEGLLRALDDGTFTRQLGGTDEPYNPPSSEASELRALLRLRDTAMTLVEHEQTELDDTPQMDQLRQQLATDYSSYVDTYGPINRFRQRRQLRPGWSVFADWCERQDLEKLPASRDLITDYLEDLRRQGLGQDQLTRHRDGIVKAHRSAEDRQVHKAAVHLVQQDQPGLSKKQLSEAAKEKRRGVSDAYVISKASNSGWSGRWPLALTEPTLQAAQQVIDRAPAVTDPQLDLDALGLRTTSIIRPPQGGFRHDPFANVVKALERFDPTTQQATRTDIFTHRVISPRPWRAAAETAEEALSICLDRHSRVDLGEIAGLLDSPDRAQARAALGELVYDEPDTGELVWSRQYLSGNVRGKLARARRAAAEDAAYEVNVAALERVVPADLGPEDIEIRLGSWIGPDYVQQFLAETLSDPTVRVERLQSLWTVSAGRGAAGSVAADEVWGTGDLDAYQLTERVLTGSEIRVMRTVTETGPDGRPQERQRLDTEATEAAKEKAEAISDRFAAWVWEDPTRADELLAYYNDRYNASIPPDFSGMSLSLPGLSDAFALREHQRTAIARIIYQPATGLVHDVGAGKTLEMIVGVMERVRRGLAHKPIVVVPNDSIAEQFEREWLQAYPGARLLTGSSHEMANDPKTGRDGRAAFVARAATGTWDALIMTKESFQRLPLPPEVQEEFLRSELDALRQTKSEHAANASESMTKRLERAIEAAEERLTARLAEIDRDVTGMTLADIGSNFTVVDEAQNYKNGLVPSNIPELGIPGSNRAIDLDMKLSWLAEQHGESRVVLATATPWTNKISEVYLWLRRLGHTLPPFDEWARTHCTAATYTEMTPGGTLQSKTRMRRVINEPELWRSLRLTSDIRMKDELGLPLPELRGGKIEVLTAPAATEAKIFTLDLARRERELSHEGRDNHLVINHDGQLVALDVRTVGLDTDERQKLHVTADDLAAEWHATRDIVYTRPDGTEHPTTGGLFLVFCDDSTPSRGWNAYDELRDLLIERGLPESEIRFIHEAPTPQRKADLLAACREGAVTVLMGSTEKMGSGVNVQTRAIGGYELTGHYLPHVSTQAQGRIERQGNQNKDFFWKRVVTSPSQDAKKWEISGQKHDMFAPMYQATQPARHRDVADPDAQGLSEVMVAATGDTRYREKAELDQEHRSLTRSLAAHRRTQQSLALTISTANEQIPRLQQQAQQHDALAAAITPTRGDAFRMSIAGRSHTNRNTAAEDLKELLNTTYDSSSTDRTVTVGVLGGFELHATMGRSEIRLFYPAARDAGIMHSVLATPHAMPTRYGLITRLENQLDSIAHAPETTRERIARLERDLEHAHANRGAAFPHEQRLAEVTARRSELLTELSGEDDRPPPDEDPDSPEAQARQQRAEQRRLDQQQLLSDAEAHARDHASRAPRDFAVWYVAITSPVVAEQRPPFDTALQVWRALLNRNSPATPPVSATPNPSNQATTDPDNAAATPTDAKPAPSAAPEPASPNPSAEPASDSPPGEVIGTVINGDGTTRSFEVPGVAPDSAPSAPDAPPESAAAGATDRADRERTAATDVSEQQGTSRAAADPAVSETRGPDELVPEVSTPAVSVRTDTAALVGRVLRLREHAVRIEAIAEHATDHRDDTIRVGGQNGEPLLPEADLAPYTSTDSRLGTVLSWRGLHLQVTWSGRYAALVGWRSGQQSSVLVHIDDGEDRLSSLTAGGLHEGLSRWLDDLPSEASWARAEVEALGTRTPATSSERQPQQGDPPAERDETAATAEAPGEQNPPAPTERTPAGEQTGAAASPNAAPPEPAPESASSTSSVDAAAEQLVPAHSVPLPSVRRGQHTLHLSREHGLVLLGIREGADHPRSLLKDQKAIDLKIGRWEKLNSGVWRAVGTQGQPHTAELLQRARNVLVRLSVTQRIEARMDLHLDVPREREAQQVLDKRTVLSQIYGLVRNALATATIHDVPLVPPHQLDQPTAAPAAPEQPSQGTRDPGAAEEPALDLGLTDPAESGPDTGEQAGAPAPSTRAGRTEDEPQPDSTPEPTGLASESGTPSTSVVVHASREHGLQLRNGTVSTLAVENARDRQVPFESWRVVLTGSDQGTWHVPGTAGKAITADQIDHLAALTRFLRSERGLAVELDVHRHDLADDAETHARWRQHADLLAPHDTTGTEPDIADTEHSAQPEDRAPTATQDTAEFAEPAETADGEQDQLQQVVSELLGRHHLEHVEGAQQALIEHVRAELADPWLSQLALVNDRDNYAMQVSARLADRFVEATMASSNDPDRLMRPLTANDSPLRDELSDWFADYSYTLLNHTNEVDTDASSESATDDQRVLRLHYSDEHGLLLLGSQREDGLGPVLRSKRAAWKHRASIVGPDPDNAAGAWFLQNTRNREFTGRNVDQRRTQYRHRLESEVIDALEHLAEAGHTVRLDVRDLPVAVINRLQRHHGRRHSADAASTRAASDELADAPEPASTDHDEQDPAQLPIGADEQHNPSEVSSDNEQPDRAASAPDPDPFRSNTPDSVPTAQPRARATQVEEPTLFGTADEPRESSNIPAQEHEPSGDASIVTTASTASAAAEEPDGQPAPPAEPDSAADPVGAAGRGDEELIRAHELAVREEERGLLRVCEPGLPAAGVVFGHPEDGWTSPQGDPVELGVWVAAYRQRAPRAGISALIKLDVELASRASALATRVIAPGTDTARTNLALALGLARGGDASRTIEGWVSAAERELPTDETPDPAPTPDTAAPAETAATSPSTQQPPVESAPAVPPERAPAEAPAAVGQPAAQERRGQRAPDDPLERIAWLNAHAAAWFDQQLQQSAQPQTYLRDRLGSDEAVAAARVRLTVGWAPDTWTGLTRHLQQLRGPDGTRAVTDEDLLTAGLVKWSSVGRLIDVFRGRVMFAFYDQHDRLAGFTGRLHPDLEGQDPRKYANTPATPLFTKGSLLIGVEPVQQQRLADGADVVLCEGPMDAAGIIAAAAAAGDDTLVPLAASGTAITNQHLDQLHTLAHGRVIHALDSGATGGPAAIDLLRRSVTRLPQPQHVTVLPHGAPPAGHDPESWSGHDPATWALQHGTESLSAYRTDSDRCQPALTQLVDERLSRYRLDETEGRVNAAHSAVALLAELDHTGPHADAVLDEAARVAPLLYETEDVALLLVHYRSLPAGTSPAEASARADQHRHILETDPDEPAAPEDAETAPDELTPADTVTSESATAAEPEPAEAPSVLPQPAVEPEPAAVLAEHDAAPIGAEPQEPAALAEPEPAPAAQPPVVVHHSHDHGSLLWGPDHAWLADALSTARLQGTRVGAWSYDPTVARPDGGTGAWRIAGTAGHLAPPEAVAMLQQARSALTEAGVPAELDLAATEATGPARALLATPDDSSRAPERAPAPAPAPDHAGAGPRARTLSATEQAAITALDPDETRNPDEHTQLALTELAGRWVLHAATVTSANNPLTLTSSFASHDAAHAAGDTMSSHTLPDIARRAVTNEQATGTLADQPLPAQLTPSALAAYDRTLAADSPSTTHGPQGKRHDACVYASGGLTVPVGAGPASTGTIPPSSPQPTPPTVERPQQQPQERVR